MLLATAYGLKIEDPDEQGENPMCWYWAECDERGDYQDEGEGPFGTKSDAEKDARAKSYEVVRRGAQR